MEFNHRYLEVNGVNLHMVEEGSGPCIILLHGFPEFWYAWKNQIQPLSKNFRVVAPDMRGYNLSEKPEGAKNYRREVLVEDIRSLIEALGEKQVTLVGHDWGGVVAWYFAEDFPEYLDKLVIINSPHHKVFARELQNNPSQQKASSYIQALVAPDGEEKCAENDYALLKNSIFNTTCSPESFSEEDKKAYVEAWSQPGALTAMINYYRARTATSTPEVTKGSSNEKIETPTLVIWGEKDAFLLTGNLEGLDKYVKDLSIKRIPEATHWVQHEKPEQVSQTITDFAL